MLKPAILQQFDPQHEAMSTAHTDNIQQANNDTVDIMLFNSSVPVDSTVNDKQEETIQADHAILDNINIIEADLAIEDEESKSRVLDIESMLAAIHSDI